MGRWRAYIGDEAIIERLEYMVELLERIAMRPVPYPKDADDGSVLRREQAKTPSERVRDKEARNG